METYDEYGDPDDILWALEDHQGTVRDIVDDADPTEIAEHRKFDSFGNMSGNTLDMPQAYTGRIWDADVELYDYRARWYDAEVGRFVSEDPSGFDGGDVNLYRYCNNSSTFLVDPYGMCWSGIGNIQTTFNYGGYTTGIPDYVNTYPDALDWINSYSTSSYSTPSYSTPSYSTPSYSTPSYSTPSYSTPSYSTPSYSTPSYSTPSYSTPSYSTPYIGDSISDLVNSWQNDPVLNITPSYDFSYTPSFDYSLNDALDYTQDWSSSIYTPAYTPSYSDPFANLSYSQQQYLDNALAASYTSQANPPMVIGLAKTNLGTAAITTQGATLDNGRIAGTLDAYGNFVAYDRNLSFPTEPSTASLMFDAVTTVAGGPLVKGSVKVLGASARMVGKVPMIGKGIIAAETVETAATVAAKVAAKNPKATYQSLSTTDKIFYEIGQGLVTDVTNTTLKPFGKGAIQTAAKGKYLLEQRGVLGTLGEAGKKTGQWITREPTDFTFTKWIKTSTTPSMNIPSAVRAGSTAVGVTGSYQTRNKVK